MPLKWLFDPAITIPKPIYHRLALLVEEVKLLDKQMEDFDVEELAVEILTEYCRQHFQDSTKQVARMFLNRP